MDGSYFLLDKTLKKKYDQKKIKLKIISELKKHKEKMKVLS